MEGGGGGTSETINRTTNGPKEVIHGAMSSCCQWCVHRGRKGGGPIIEETISSVTVPLTYVQYFLMQYM